MSNLSAYRYSIVVAGSVLTLIAIGAYVTSRATSPQFDARRVLDANIHAGAAIAVGIAALYLALRQPELDGAVFGWAGVALFAIQGAVGWLGEPLLHASLAPMVFAAFAATAFVSSPGWNQPPELVDERTVPFLRPFAIAGPPLIVLQTLLGAAYRHRFIGVMPHLGGAMVVGLATLIPAMLLLHRCPTHRALRSAAGWLVAIVLAQVVLGVAAFSMQLLGLASAVALVVSTALHVVGGSLTLSASVLLAMQTLRHVRALGEILTPDPDQTKSAADVA